MRIGIDGKIALQDNGEEGKKASLFIEKIAESYPGSDFLVYTSRLGSNRNVQRLQQIYNVRFCLPAQSGFQGELWRKFGITNNLPADKIDVYYGSCGELPLNIRESGIPSVVTVDNLLWISNPENFSFISRKIKNFICRKSCLNADIIVVPDEKIKEDLCKFYVISPDKIEIKSPYLMAADFMSVMESVSKPEQ